MSKVSEKLVVQGLGGCISLILASAVVSRTVVLFRAWVKAVGLATKLKTRRAFPQLT